jgi:hypothetical protein
VSNFVQTSNVSATAFLSTVSESAVRSTN